MFLYTEKANTLLIVNSSDIRQCPSHVWWVKCSHSAFTKIIIVIH